MDRLVRKPKVGEIWFYPKGLPDDLPVISIDGEYPEKAKVLKTPKKQGLICEGFLVQNQGFFEYDYGMNPHLREKALYDLFSQTAHTLQKSHRAVIDKARPYQDDRPWSVVLTTLGPEINLMPTDRGIEIILQLCLSLFAAPLPGTQVPFGFENPPPLEAYKDLELFGDFGSFEDINEWAFNCLIGSPTLSRIDPNE